MNVLSGYVINYWLKKGPELGPVATFSWITEIKAYSYGEGAYQSLES